MPLPRPADASLLVVYTSTLWSVSGPEGEISLRLGSPFRVPGLLPCGIVTAYNPRSILCDLRENRAANERLRAALRAAGGRCLPVVARGSGADAELWTEPGFLVSGIEREALVEIADRFGQNAIVWVPEEDARPVLVATRDGFAGAARGDRLPSP